MAWKPGLTPVSRVGAADSGQINYYRIANGTGVPFYAGQLVALSTDGTLAPATNLTAPVGVFAGALWIDGTSKRPVRSLYVPAGTSTEGGVIDGLNTVKWDGVIAQVYDDPQQNFVIAALASVLPTAQGAYAQVGNNTTGSSYSGRSNAALSLGTGTSVTNAAFRVVGVVTYDNMVGAGVSAAPDEAGDLSNTWQSALTKVQVIIAKHLYARD